MSKLFDVGWYISEQLKGYIEPQRKGIPRGQPIGMHKNKFTAALLISLTNVKQRQIARDMDINYGLLRKWNSEKEFQKAKSRHRRRFIELFESLVICNVQDNLPVYAECFTNGLCPESPLRHIRETVSVLNPATINELSMRHLNMQYIRGEITTREEIKIESGLPKCFEWLIYVWVMNALLNGRKVPTRQNDE